MTDDAADGEVGFPVGFPAVISLDPDLPTQSTEPRRSTCTSCERPASVCWCQYVAKPPLKIETKFIILQHPKESKRAIRTALMAAKGIADARCRIVVGKEFPGTHRVGDESAEEIFTHKNTYLLFPGPDATDVASLDRGAGPYTFCILDGTWDEARKLFGRNPSLQKLPRACLSLKERSSYVVRTQPSDSCLSTVESVAQTLALVEGRPEVVEQLLRPLLAMCNFQVNHGSVVHDSKEFKRQNEPFVKVNVRTKDGNKGK